jgi:hypothetical protein
VREALGAHARAHARGAHGQVAYDLRGDFGVDPGEVRRRFAFYFERFAVRAEDDAPNPASARPRS